MSWREFFLENLGPAGFSGMTLADCLGVFADNRFRVSPRYWARAANIVLNCTSNSVLRQWENLRHGRRIRATNVPPPLFILGVWRSGTTHLHNLLAQDDRFAAPSTFETFYPHTFLTTQRINGPLMESVMPKTRPQDNVVMGINEPQEDEFALCGMTGLSFYLSWAFPRATRYTRYLTLRDATAAERRRWQEALLAFVQKLTYRHRKPLVLKSPAHMGRIPLLLDAFPQAKFLHIHRHPYAVFKSSLHTARAVTKIWALQRYQPPDMEAVILRQHREVYDAYFEERSLIDPARFYELSYDEVTRDPIAALRTAYEKLDLPAFAHAEPRIQAYLGTLADYQRNSFPDLPPGVRERIAHAWRPCFEAWGYSS